jgi:hypothetical protein
VTSARLRVCAKRERKKVLGFPTLKFAERNLKRVRLSSVVRHARALYLRRLLLKKKKKKDFSCAASLSFNHHER